jgi:hypothetical protein
VNDPHVEALPYILAEQRRAGRAIPDEDNPLSITGVDHLVLFWRERSDGVDLVLGQRKVGGAEVLDEYAGFETDHAAIFSGIAPPAGSKRAI